MRLYRTLEATMVLWAVKFDKLQALHEARADAGKKCAEYEAAVKLLTEQSNELAGELRALVDELARRGMGFKP